MLAKHKLVLSAIAPLMSEIMHLSTQLIT
ncbi:MULTISPECIES: hypothetical protein [unclassified Colwellia]|nr:hypothetical protein [Colwellia sp. MB3u-55]